ncbi:hypothetical protein TH25_13960 [Thalassospira profundimaris]|uniref:Uncharacterized protein n=1 Tax=Thalassospira profundimaris TaxID=502049 RepID=A0A367X7M5_9PROT|nr:hypothetical protein [Thalassospira profundimaris]RCK48702.1 hypothetical protein TH25_13960 [Thalassospira profundimaris]
MSKKPVRPKFGDMSTDAQKQYVSDMSMIVLGISAFLLFGVLIAYAALHVISQGFMVYCFIFVIGANIILKCLQPLILKLMQNST